MSFLSEGSLRLDILNKTPKTYAKDLARKKDINEAEAYRLIATEALAKMKSKNTIDVVIAESYERLMQCADIQS